MNSVKSWIKRLLVQQNIINSDDELELDLSTVVKQSSYSCCTGKVNGVRRQLKWNHVSITQHLYRLMERKTTQIKYDASLKRPVVLLKDLKDSQELKDIIEIDFDEPIYRHPCFFGTLIKERTKK